METAADKSTGATLKRIEQTNGHLNSFLEVFTDAKPAAAGKDRPLEGLPMAVKSNICTLEGHTTAASHILETYEAPYEATVITKLKAAGAVIVGKTNLDEFAMGSSGEYSAFGATKNPWHDERIPGGSSAGSAAAVASGQVPAALGTDTGGSIRQPAAMCGIVGLKPTYGRVSRFGVIAYGSSLDQVGPLTRTVKDSARLLHVLAGEDPYDATTSDTPVPDYEAACTTDIRGLRIGVPEEFFTDDVNEEVRTTVRQALQDLEQQGAELVPISLPLTPAAVAVYFLIAKSESSSNLARFDGLRYAPIKADEASLLEQYLQVRGRNFGPEVKRAILMGTYALSAGYYDAWYKKTAQVRRLIREEYEQAFQKVDVIAGPTSPEAAFEFGSKTDDPLAMYLADAFTVPMSVAGLPAISIPCGFASLASAQRSSKSEVGQKLPVGLQLTASHFEEARLFNLAHAYEQSHDWHQQTPPLLQ